VLVNVHVIAFNWNILRVDLMSDEKTDLVHV